LQFFCFDLTVGLYAGVKHWMCYVSHVVY